MSTNSTANLEWHKALEPDALPEGRVVTVSIERQHTVTQLAVTHHEGQYAALDNACPHQGGPLGEGSIECDESTGDCFLRCPWHGWDYDPLTGKSPGGFDDGVATHPVEVRDDGVYVGLPAPPARPRSVTDVMAETMTAWGVTHCFGMVGHSNLGLADALRVQEEAGRLEYIGIRHEGAAAFAASAFGKLTGLPASCLTIAGPGATNLLTGVWDAKVDRAPMLALTGQVNQQVFGPGAFQELPLKDAFSAACDFSHLALPGSKHAELMSLACKHAIVERKPAHLIFPDDVQPMLAGDDAAGGSPEGRIAHPQIAPPGADLEKAIVMLRAAERPAIIVGHGARFEIEAVIALAEELGCPVLTTFKGKGIIGDAPDPDMPSRPGHPLGAGVLGRSGTPVASWFMNECDLLLVFGASFSDHTGITPKKPIIQIDLDRWHLGKGHPVALPVWGEIGVTAALLREAVTRTHTSIDHTAEIAERWRIWRAEKKSRLTDDESQGVASISIFDAMNRTIPGDAILAVDVGNNTYSFGRYFEASGRQAVLMSGYLGSIGFGYPAAIGSWAATRAHKFVDPASSAAEVYARFKDRPVVAVTGDGGFGQYPWEVNTAVKYSMNLTHILLRNDELGKISKEQRAAKWEVWQTSLTNPNIADYVNSCGGLGLRVTKKVELDAAIERALAHQGPATVEVITNAALI
ncbi:MAG: thiamine pyrophosphate-binding protein [Planctomycetota bacterium]